MSFLLFLVGFLEKWTKRENFGQLRLRIGEETPRNDEGPHSSEGSRRREAEREGWPSLEFLRRGEATVHSMENCCVSVLFCFSVAPRTGLLDK